MVEVKLDAVDGEIDESQRRRIAYGSVAPFSILQSRKNSIWTLSKMSTSSSPYHADRYYSVTVNLKTFASLLSNDFGT